MMACPIRHVWNSNKYRSTLGPRERKNRHLAAGRRYLQSSKQTMRDSFFFFELPWMIHALRWAKVPLVPASATVDRQSTEIDWCPISSRRRSSQIKKGKRQKKKKEKERGMRQRCIPQAPEEAQDCCSFFLPLMYKSCWLLPLGGVSYSEIK